MLPDFPETRFEYDRLISHRIQSKAKSLSVVEQLIKGVTQHEGQSHAYHQEGNGTVTEGYESISVEISVKPEEVPLLIGQKLFDKLDSIAEEKAKQVSALFYRKMDEVTQKTGNIYKTESGSLTKELALEMVQSNAWSPDSVFLAHPVAAKAMGDAWIEWQKDSEFMKKFNASQAIKKEEWRARENCRKLVD